MPQPEDWLKKEDVQRIAMATFGTYTYSQSPQMPRLQLFAEQPHLLLSRTVQIPLPTKQCLEAFLLKTNFWKKD